jgi:hypothetical protein
MSPAVAQVTSMLQHALAWAKRGFHVFPVHEMTKEGHCSCSAPKPCLRGVPGKHPRIKNNLVMSTTDEKQIREWWARWPNANIGIATGLELPGGGFLMVVDTDPRHDGDQTLRLLEEKHGQLPETPRNVTGGGGEHYYLKVDRPIPSTSGQVGTGLDIKCFGGYVIAPPSNHASGRTYEQDAGADFDELEIAQAPEWLRVLADRPRTEAKASLPAADLFIEGGRHNALVTFAGVMRRRGLSPMEILPSLQAINDSRCRPPLDPSEVRSIATSATWEPQDPIAANDPWNMMNTEQIFAPLPPYPWLIEGLHLAPGRITLLNGYADVGKTVIAMTVALSVVSGKPVWDVFKPNKTGKVLHLNGEIGSYIARERYQRLARGMGIDAEALAASGLLTLSNYPRARLDDKDFEEKLLHVVQGHQLVIVDSLRAFSGALDEKAKEIGVALFSLARVSQATGATILVLHHNRKPSKDDVGGAKMAISGSSSILGGAECAFVMTSTEKGGPIIVEHERSPIGRPMGDFGLQIEDLPFGDDPRWGLRVTHLEPEQLSAASERAEQAKERLAVEKAKLAILATLEQVAGAFRGSQEQFRTMAGVGKGPFARALGELCADGRVSKQGPYHRPEWHLS